MIGSSLAHFKITAKLGEGGMGEVYRAEDTKLGREVAIKVLPESVAQDAERLARFQREAMMLASLNHPNIAAIYSLETAEQAESGAAPTSFLVMELAEGMTIRDRLGRGPILLEESLAMALQMANAMEEAHRQGVIHRDLKPANVMVDDEDNIKVLDFGLAKALDPTAASSEINPSASPLSLSPTLTAQMTGAGVLLGTAAYMSPEQARGKKADKRADIWAFGVVLWEMLTGKRLFEGETVSDTLAAVLRADPDWDSLPSETPRSVHRLLRRCLERNPKERLHDIADARLEIEAALDLDPAEAGWVSDEQVSHRSGRSLWLGLAAGLALGALATFFVTTLVPMDEADTASSTLRVASGTPNGEALQVFNQPSIAISPDGQRLVVSMLKDDEFVLYQRPLHQFEWSLIPGTEDAVHPFFSPDGEWIAFFADEKLMKVSLAGGTPQVLCDAPNPFGGAWGPNGVIVFNSASPGGLNIVSELGGSAEILTRPDFESNESEHDWPQFLPDGKSIIFSIWKGSSAENSQIALWDLETKEKTVLIDGSFGRVTSSGHLLFARADSIYVVPFDLEARTIVGEPIPLADPIYRFMEYWMPILDVSSSGTLAYLPGRSDARHQLVSVAPDGSEELLTEVTGNYLYPRLSPDGQKLAVTMMENGKGDIWILDLKSGNRTRLTREGNNHAPLWTRDGERVLYQSNRSGFESVLWQASDGSDEAETLVAGDGSLYIDFPTDVSPDGKHLVYSAVRTSDDDQFESITLQLLSLDNPSEVTALIFSDDKDQYYGGADISPDGRWFAFIHGDGDSPYEVYVQAFPDGGARHKISQEGGLKPQWSPDGRAIYYRKSPSEPVMMVPFRSEPLDIGAPRPLFKDNYSYGVFTSLPAYDTQPGTPNLIMVKRDEELGKSQEIRLVLNWLDELEALVPGGSR